MVKSQCAKLLDIVTLLMKQTEEQPQTERDLGACQDGKLLIMDMKDGIRQQSEGLESLREATTGAKTELDSLNLTLQNLLYEKSFYETEIRKCQDFRSAYSAEDISLIPLEDYRSLTGDAEAKEDHETMLKRLSHEIQRRKDLHARLEEVKKQRAAAEASEAKQRAFLSELSAQLKGIGKAAEGVRGQVEVRRGAMASAGSRADLLPMPLYILYSQLVACVDAHGLAASVAVEGSAQEAEAFHEEAPADQNRDCGPDARAEADGDIEMMEAEGRRGGEAKPGAKAAGSGVPKRDLYQKHPLSVVASLLNSESDSGTLMAVVFHYLPSLNIITAEAQDPADNVFLANLFPGDTGAESPNEANNQLQGGAFKFDMTRAGRPYRWAQHLAGLDFLPAVPSRMPEGPSAAALSSGIAEYRSQARPAVVLSTLRQRKEAAPSLKAQLDSLRRKSLPATHRPAWLPVIKCKIHLWKEMPPVGTSPVLLSAAYSQLLGAGVVSRSAKDAGKGGGDSGAERGGLGPAAKGLLSKRWHKLAARTFKLLLLHADVELEARVEVTREYPLRPPHFHIARLSWEKHPGQKQTVSLPSAELYAFQVEANLRGVELLSRSPRPAAENLLTWQVATVMAMFDCYAAHITSRRERIASGIAEGPEPTRGRERRRTHRLFGSPA